MLCNVYIKESTAELRAIGFRSSTPVFFIDVSQNTMNRLKLIEAKGVLEIHPVQSDPYLKDLSSRWVNGGAQLPEVRIVEKIVQAPPIIIEKTIEVPVEVIREVQVIKEVIKEIIREVEVFKEPAVVSKPVVLTEAETKKAEQTKALVDADEILIDTKIAFEDWKTKNGKTPKVTPVTKSVTPVVEPVEELLPLPDKIVDPLAEDDTMPILLEVEPTTIVDADSIIEHIETVKATDSPGPADIPTKQVKKRGPKPKKKEPTTPLTEFTVPLTEEEIKKYDKEKVEE